MSQDKLFVGVVKVKTFNWGEITNIWLRKEDIALINANVKDSGDINIDMKTSQGGKLYMEINTFQSSGSGSTSGNTQAAIAEPADISGDDDLPF